MYTHTQFAETDQFCLKFVLQWSHRLILVFVGISAVF